MLINVILKTSEYRGDHNAEIGLAITVDPEMTIKKLMDKCYKDGVKCGIGKMIGNELTDHIEIRIAH